MRVLVISDNHRDLFAMEEILSIHEGQVDVWLHCGDSELKPDNPHWQRYKPVRGNMDFTDAFPISRVEEYYGEKFLVVHGHKHQVKVTFEPLKQEAKEKGARIAFYGHTHIPKVDKEEGIYFINPGSIAQPRGPIRKGTYAIVEIEGDKGNITYYDEDHSKVEELSQSLSLG